jgi:hypothetical protein
MAKQSVTVSKDGTNGEVGMIYTASGSTLTRSVTKPTNSDAAINLSGRAEVYLTARAEDFDANLQVGSFTRDVSFAETGFAGATRG